MAQIHGRMGLLMLLTPPPGAGPSSSTVMGSDAWVFDAGVPAQYWSSKHKILPLQFPCTRTVGITSWNHLIE